MQSKGRSNAKKYTLAYALAAQIKSSNAGSNVGSNVVERLAQELNLSSDILKRVYAYRNRQRNPREETDSLLLSICSGRQVTLSQLCLLLNREMEPLRRDFVTPLVRHRKLEYTAEKGNAPHQAYTTVVITR